MRKILGITAIALALALALLAPPAAAQPWDKPFGSTTTPFTALLAASASTATGATASFDTAGATSILFHVSGTASGSSIAFQQSIDGSAFYTSVTVVNATASGEMWACPAARGARFYTNSKVGDGPVSVLVTTRSVPGDPLGSACHRVDTYAAFTVAGSTGTFSVTAGKSAAITQSLTFAGTDATTMTFPTTTATVARTDAAQTFTGIQTFSSPVAGALKTTIAAKLIDGAIASAPGVIVITKGSALGSSSLATPTSTTHDGYVMTIVSSTAYAHVVSCTSGKINGGTTTTVTFTSAAIGDSVTIVAYQGIWYVIDTTGTISLS